MKIKSKIGLINVFLIVFSIGVTPATYAATNISKAQANKAVTNIKSEITLTKLKLASLKSKETDETNSAYNLGSSQVAKLQSEYDSLKKNLDSSRADAVAKLTSLSVFKVMVNNISACGAEFQTHCEMNQTIAIPPTAKVDVDFLMKIGGLVPVDEASYKATKTTIATIETSLTDAFNKLNNDKAEAQALYTKTVTDIQARYGQLSIATEDYLSLLEKCLKASSRASKVGANFLVAFKTAYVFDFNYQSIVVVAKTPFEDINSLLSLNIIRDAVKYAGIGDAIDSRYSDSKAAIFNRYYGDTFFDSDFNTNLSSALNIYKKFAK